MLEGGCIQFSVVWEGGALNLVLYGEQTEYIQFGVVWGGGLYKLVRFASSLQLTPTVEQIVTVFVPFLIIHS